MRQFDTHRNNQLLRPKFLPLLEPSQCGTIVNLVQKLIQILSSDAVVIDGRHAPALYSKFLSTLLDKHYTPAIHQEVTSSEIYSQYQENREVTPPHVFSWPDVPAVSEPLPLPNGMTDADTETLLHVVRQQVGDADMDFSLSHFVSSSLPSHQVPSFQELPLEVPEYPYHGLPLYMYNSHQFNPHLPYMSPMQSFHMGQSAFGSDHY